MKLKLAFLALALCLGAAAESDPWPATALVAPQTLAARLKTHSVPHILYVGFPVLYKGAHISRASFAGPCSKPEGLKLLNEAVKALPHDSEILLYCGCCPFVRCPNVRPAFQALHDAGYTNVKVLHLDTNLHMDWTEKGYPIEKAGQKQ